ncbi:hypothetical protein B566_EDAN009244 [Ephemera danica]|nr:hypothetical protein B566_EDAN009244 [Ephemera danica]
MTFYSYHKTSKEPCTIEHLPDEVLEFIIRLVSPYQDLQNCSLVCKRWHLTVQCVRRIIRNNFQRAILDFNVRWEEHHVPELVPTISKRHSHSACCYDNSMYVFGGCTSTCSTFNDLWRLDLTKRIWVRPLTMGTYPSPKACASLVYYKDSLILFGGWSHPSPYPLHQAWRLFNELHEYSIPSNRWTCLIDVTSPPAVAGHSASIHDSTMVIFGGLQKKSSLDQFNRSNDIWCFDFNGSGWRIQPTTEPQPQPRYGQSQIKLSDRYLLIIGGCGGSSVIFSDVWLLDMGGEIPDAKGTWVWTKIEVLGQQNAPAHLWCHPACKIGHSVITFARNPESAAPMMPYKSWKLGSQVWVPPRQYDFINSVQPPAPKKGPGTVDVNVNGRRGTLNRRSASSDDSDLDAPGPSRAMYSGAQQRQGVNQLVRNTVQPSVRPNAMRNRARQLELLRRMEERIRGMAPSPPPPPPPPVPKTPRNAMTMFVMDISEVLTHGRVAWLPLKPTPPSLGPEETILYSLVAGVGELIMFGGIEKDAMSLLNPETRSIVNTVSNNLRFISAPREVV